MATRLKRIPDEITYVSQRASTRKDLYDDGTLTCYPTYPLDASNTRRLESARKWAGVVHAEVTEPNTPKLYRITALEHRGEGGRAYKVCDTENRMFDLREDMLVESWGLAGMNPGGELNAEFVWSLQGTEMKLCPVNGKTYNNLLEEDQRYEYDTALGLNKVKTTTKYEIGKAYSTPSGEKDFIYLGVDPENNKHVFIQFFTYSSSKTGLYYYEPVHVNKPARVEISVPAVDSKSVKDHMDFIQKEHERLLFDAKSRAGSGFHSYSYLKAQVDSYQKRLDSFVALRTRLGI